jgi:type II secretory pathway pseudopilin PulG
MMQREQADGSRQQAAKSAQSVLSAPCPLPAARFASAFTLTEIMVVIVIIVLMLAMAMPVFRAMTGSRSEEAASNQIAGMLGRTRNEAIGVQQNRGLAFFTDSAGRCQTAIVQRESDIGFKPWIFPPNTPAYSKGDYVQRTAGSPANPIITYWVAINDVPANTQINITTYWQPCDYYAIDKTPDSDAEPLPQGVGVKLINDWGAVSTTMLGSSTQVSDGYLSIGVIMFDKNGQLTTTQYSVAASGFLGTTMQLNQLSGNPNNYPAWPGNSRTQPANSASKASANLYAIQAFANSQFGLVLYDRDAYQSRGFTNSDPTYTTANYSSGAYTAGSPSEQQADLWLDQNASPLLINRYNGTLVKGE